MARGTLRIYLGAAPGVGKTVAMLSEAHRRRDRGTDVVIGLVETHGRSFTAQLLEGLERIPTREIEYRGATFRELDVDAVIARRPRVVLIDELAHTNVPGSRHTKRWEDIEDVLDAGIDVISTVNIQHLESLNDVTEAITGVRQRATVPDDVVRAADQIELVDMSPEALRRRMAHGNIYAAEKVDAALSNYFRVGNLSALRELALVWLADRVDEALERYRHDQGISETWPARERVVVALTGGPESDALLRRGARIASAGAGGELVAVYVARSDGLVGASLEQLAEQRRLTAELGGTFHTVTGDDVAEAVLEFARGVNASQIVLGVSRRGRLQSLLSRGVGESVIAESGDIDVHIVSHGYRRRGLDQVLPDWTVGRRRTISAWVISALGLPLLTWALASTREHHDLPLEMLLYLALTVATALVGGIWPALFSAIVGSLLLNYYFAPPLHTFTIDNPGNALAVLVFVLVAASVASVVHISALRASKALAAQQESRILAQLAHSLLGTPEQLPTLLEQARDTFSMRTAAVVRRASVRDPWEVLAATEGFDVALVEGAEVRSRVNDTTFLVMTGRVPPASQGRLVSAFASHAAAILTREELVEEARAAGALAKDNRTRTALLAAVSHDLRTPLAGIKAAVSSLRQTDVTWSAEDEAELLESIEASADRLNALIGNLLDMSRLQSGTVAPHLQPLHLDEVVARTVAALPDGQRVRTWIPHELPPALADAGLLDRVLANVLENALRHSPGRQEVVVNASRIGGHLQLRVVDRGSGVPDSAKEGIFAPFQRFGDVPRGSGVGLGLAVARGLAEAMNGSLTAEDTPGGGLTIVVDLPVAGGQLAGPTPPGQAPEVAPSGGAVGREAS
ncbi:MAG: ATP-binding protein [Oryzihumus sp.]